MSLWTKTDGADTADTTSVTITTTSGSKTVSTANTAAIKRFDQVTGTGIPVNTTVTKVVDGQHFTISRAATASGSPSDAAFVHKNVNKPKYLTVAEQKKTFGVDANEVLLKPVTHTGWVRVTEGSGGRAGRKLYETIVALGTITSDAEDVAFPDPTITISAQPTSQTIRLASGVNNTSPITFGATVSVTGKGLTPSYQWTVSDTSVGTYTNVVNVSGNTGISGATTNTLTLKSKAVNTKFYKLGVSVAAPMGALTSVSNAAKVIGSQVTESITWSTGFVTVTTTAPHGFTNGDSITLAGFTPSGYNGAQTIANASGSTFTFPLVTDPGTATVQGTATKTIVETVSTGTWSGGTATITTAAPHGFTTGDSITIAGSSNAGYDGVFTIANASGSTFDYTVADPTGSSTGGTATKTIVATSSTSAWTSNVATVTAASHGLVPSDQVVVAGVTSTNYNGTKTVLTSDANTFTYAIETAESSASVQGEIYKVVA